MVIAGFYQRLAKNDVATSPPRASYVKSDIPHVSQSNNIGPSPHLSLRRFGYKRTFFALCTLLWLLIALLIMALPTEYASKWTLILPGAGDGLAVSLESIGQASASHASPYTNSSLNPSVNYKAISLSEPVLANAANRLGITIAQLGKPKVKLVDQTSLIHYQIKGHSAEAAQQKAHALYHALLTELDRLRDDEMARIQSAQLTTLADFSRKLSAAQHEKLNYQTSAGILSVTQFQQLVTHLEDERARQTDLQRQERALKQKIETLLAILQLSPEQVAAAVTLRNDGLFQDYLQRHADIHAQLATVRGSWGANHPKRRQLDAAHHSINHAIEQRGKALTQQGNVTITELIEVGNTRFESNLLTDLIRFQADHASLVNQLSSGQKGILGLQQRIDASASDAIAIEDLSRKQQVATAVFSTALAKQDIGKVDRFASYPLVQMLSAPSLAAEPDNLKHILTLVGGVFATLFIALGLVLLCYRHKFIPKA